MGQKLKKVISGITGSTKTKELGPNPGGTSEVKNGMRTGWVPELQHRRRISGVETEEILF